MGTWGEGNFQSDCALDMLGEVKEPLIAEIQAFMRSDRVGAEDVEDTMPCVAIITVLQEHCGGSIPDQATIHAWKLKYLEVFDKYFADLEPSEGHQEKRRAVIETTFAKLESLAR